MTRENEERAREIVDRFSEQGLEFVSERFEDRVTSRGIARGLIAAALDEAEARGRDSVTPHGDPRRAIEQARAEGMALADNHHNALKCPYCNPKRDEELEQARAEGREAERKRIREKAQALNAERRQIVAAQLVLCMLDEEDRALRAGGGEGRKEQE